MTSKKKKTLKRTLKKKTEKKILKKSSKKKRIQSRRLEDNLKEKILKNNLMCIQKLSGIFKLNPLNSVIERSTPIISSWLRMT